MQLARGFSKGTGRAAPVPTQRFLYRVAFKKRWHIEKIRGRPQAAAVHPPAARPAA